MSKPRKKPRVYGTAKCKRCGAEGLDWYEYHLFTADNKIHRCDEATLHAQTLDDFA